MKIIYLARGRKKWSDPPKFVKVDDEDFDRLSKFNWFLDQGYARYIVNGSKQSFNLSHEVIGKPPKGYTVHHIDYDKSNYQSANLKFVREGTNSHYYNGKRPISGYFGVYCNGGGFMARIYHKRVSHYLGQFKTAIEAAKVYDKKSREFYGTAAKLNFP